MKEPKVSIVIVNYNGKDVTEGAIKALTEQSYKKIEIIVVDNDSTDGSQEMIKRKYRNVKLIENRKNLGYCGINSGLSSCKGEYIFFTNNDISLGKDCIKRLVDALEKDKSMGIASPKVVNYFDRNLQSCGTWVSRAFYNGHFKCDKDFSKEIPYNGIAMVRKEIVDRFGYIFDDDYFTYAEDLDLCLRTRLLGYTVVHIPEAVLYHMHELTLRKNKKYKLTYMLERNLLMTFFKILSLKNIIIFLPYVMAMRFVAILKDVFTLKFANAGARLAAILNVLVDFGQIIKKRDSIQKLRKKDDSFLFKVFSENYLFGSRKINV